MEVAVAANREQAIGQWNRPKLDRAPDLYTPDFSAVESQRAYRSIRAAQQNLCARDSHRCSDRPVEPGNSSGLGLGFGIDAV